MGRKIKYLSLSKKQRRRRFLSRQRELKKLKLENNEENLDLDGLGLTVKNEDLSKKNESTSVSVACKPIQEIHFGCCPNQPSMKVESFRCYECQLWFHSSCIAFNPKGNDKLLVRNNQWKCFNCTPPAYVKTPMEVLHNDEMRSIEYSKTFLKKENEILELKLEHITKWVQKQFGVGIPQDLMDTTIITATTATAEALNYKSVNFNRESSSQESQDHDVGNRIGNNLLENEDLISESNDICENNGNGSFDDDNGHQDWDQEPEPEPNFSEPEKNEFTNSTSTPTTTDQKNDDKIDKVSSHVPVEHDSNDETPLESSNPSSNKIPKSNSRISDTNLILTSNSRFVLPKSTVLHHYFKNIQDKNSVKSRPPPLPSNNPNVKVKKVLYITKSTYEEYLKQNRLKELEKEMGREASSLQFVKKLAEKRIQAEKKTPLKKVPNPKSESEFLLIECQFCSQKFSKTGLILHMRSRHPDPNAPKDMPSKPKKVKEPSMCAECGKLIPFGKMGVHVKTYHSILESLLCPELNCGKVFNHKGLLRTHLRAAHYEPAEYLNCPEEGCQKKFKTKQSLRYHQEIHAAKGMRNFSCTICDKTFATRNCLAAHKRMSHAKEVNHEFKCTFEGCNLGYSIRRYLEDHLKTHDPNYQPVPQPKLNICHYCAKEYETVPQLNRHIQNVHELASAT